MFPLRDSLRARRFQWVTLTLVILNIVGFVLEVQGGIDRVVDTWGLVPAHLVRGLSEGHPAALLRVGSSMFLHGDLLHLLGNLWFLWIFGDNVEDRLGRVGFVAFYLTCGVVAAVSQVVADPASEIPMVGASGAIAGVLGAYMRLFPGARVLTAVPLFIFVQLMEIRAAVFLGIWFVIQIGSSFLGYSGVAWWAHIAGFATGLLISLFFGGPAPRPAPRPRAQRRVSAW